MQSSNNEFRRWAWSLFCTKFKRKDKVFQEISDVLSKVMGCCIPLTLREIKAGNSTLAYQRAVTFYRFSEYCLVRAKLQNYIKEIRKTSRFPTIQGLPCLSTLCEQSHRFQKILTTSTALRFWQWSLFPHWGKVLHLCPLLSVRQQRMTAFHSRGLCYLWWALPIPSPRLIHYWMLFVCFL